MKKWTKEGFEAFRKGEFGNGGQNIYVSKKGILQRIHNFDVDGNGYPDIPYANSHGLRERQPVKVYTDYPSLEKFDLLPTNGPYDGFVADLNGDGYDDLIVACQNNGTHAENDSVVYYGSENGISEDFRINLYTPDAISVTVGDYNGNGRKDICFVCNGSLKIFTQNERGFNTCDFYELQPKVAVENVFTADINGDGYDDLYVKQTNGSSAVYFGGENGICEENLVVFVASDEQHDIVSTSTAGRRHVYQDWRTAIVTVNGEYLLFRGSDDKASFYKYEDGKFELAFEYACKFAKYAYAFDFDGDGQEDIVVLCQEDRDREDESYILWNDGGKFGENVTTFTTQSARTASAAVIDGEVQLIVAQSGNFVSLDAPSLIIRFKERSLSITKFMTEDCPRLLLGDFCGNGKLQLVSIQHESGGFRGNEDVCFYLGDKDGYDPDRKISLLGISAIDLKPIDFNDDGYPDAFVSNCNENWVKEEPGSFLYFNGPRGFNRNQRTIIPTVRNHGSCVADFSHSGYLDIVVGGIANREIRVLHGGPEGYTTDNMTKLVFGPDPENYEPPIGDIWGGDDKVSKEEMENFAKWGQMRWNYAADFNGDGWLDMFVSVIGSGKSYILWNGPDGFSMNNITELNTEGAICATVADLNKNGYPDLIIGCHYVPSKGMKNRYHSYIYIYWGGPEGYSEHRRTMLPAFSANSITVGDFNGNGWLDIYATSYNNGYTRDLVSYIYLNDGGHFSVKKKQLLFNHSGSGCFAGDFNGDGYCDLAVASHKDEGDHVTTSYIYWGGPDGINEGRKVEIPTIGPHGMCNVDPGNYMDRGEREYYTSEVYDSPAGMASISYDAEFLSTSWLEIEYRTGKCEKCLEGAEWKKVAAGEKFAVDTKLQYRLALCAKCGCGTPRVSKVEVIFD